MSKKVKKKKLKKRLKPLPHWLQKTEHLIDKAIPPSLLILLIIIVLELAFSEFVETHHLETYIEIADYLIIGLFVGDLVFKYRRVREIPLFIRKYWLDILAVFPFFLVFRLYELITTSFSLVMSESAQTVQAVVHEGLEIEKEGSRIIREAEVIAKAKRATKFQKFLRPLMRLPRFFKAVPKILKFYDEPRKKKVSSSQSAVGRKKK